MDHPGKTSEDPPPPEVSAALATMLSVTPAAVIVLRRDVVIYSNWAADHLMRSPTSLVGRAVIDLAHPSERPGLRRRLSLHERQRLQLLPTAFELDLLRADGEAIRIQSWAHTIECHAEPMIGLICCDITTRAAREQAWQRAATHDPLTGLPNRVLLVDRLESAMSGLGRHCRQVLVMMLDLDGFKSVNDTYGHAAGDRLLQEVALRLRGSLRAGDTVARLAGDEFVICAELDDTTSGRAGVLRRVQTALDAPLLLDGVTLSLSAGIGVLTLDQPQDAHRVIDEVDRRMYQQKQSLRTSRRPSANAGIIPPELPIPPQASDDEGSSKRPEPWSAAGRVRSSVV